MKQQLLQEIFNIVVFSPRFIDLVPVHEMPSLHEQTMSLFDTSAVLLISDERETQILELERVTSAQEMSSQAVQASVVIGDLIDHLYGCPKEYFLDERSQDLILELEKIETC